MLTPDHITLDIGPSAIGLRPLEPFVWHPLVDRLPGPAGLCLELLARADVEWQGIQGRDEYPAPSRANLAALPAGLCGRLLAALCAPWLTDDEAQGLRRLQGHAAAQADYPSLDCAACRSQEALGEGAPDCAACPIAAPPPEAHLALNLHRWLGHGPTASHLLEAATQGLGPRQARLLAMRLCVLDAARLRAEADRRLAAHETPC